MWIAQFLIRLVFINLPDKVISSEIEYSIKLARTLEAMHVVDNSSNIASSSYVTHVNELACSKRDGKDVEPTVTKSLGFALNFKIDVPNLPEKIALISAQESLGCTKDKEYSECRTYPSPRDEKEIESMKMWKAMKQNGFLSSSHGRVTSPRHKGQAKKHRKDTVKRMIGLAKKEQMNRFSKVAAPSGLLSGLDPGIINHVRNSKQVFSIIEALIKSEKPMTRCSIESAKVSVKNEDKAMKDIIHNVEYEADSRQACTESPFCINNVNGNPKSTANCKKNALDASGCSSSFYIPSRPQQKIERLNSKLSSSKNLSFVSSSGMSDNPESVSSLSVEAARVASQWLELLQQDLRGRLAAIKGSRSRFRDMTERELSSLFSKTPVSHQEKNDLRLGKPHNLSQVHAESWQSIFSQMEKALYEEETQLGLSLKQVNEMKEHCDRGLLFLSPSNDSQHHKMNKGPRMNQEDAYERECAVQAAAASFYSTCNLIIR